ncbi:MAG: iron ABC transporter permease, partial [Coriobacteriales bacterium]|nr:iron ABC transporter permease [Coriobacteriales bacterium]
MSAKVRKEGTSLESVSQDTGELLDEVRIETDDVRSKANAVFGSKVPLWLKIAIPIALIAIFVVSFSVGRFPISPGELVKTLSNGIAHHVGALFGNDIPIADERMYTVVFKIRLPRVLVVILTGAALAVSGASYQGMFKNPLVSPDLLGASAGASVGACLGLLLNMPTIVIQLWAFVGGLTAVGMAVWLNKFVKYDATLGLVLGGILVSTLFQSGMSLIKFMADGDDKLPSITFWLMGSFSSINSRDSWLILLPMAVGFALLLL